MKSSLIMDEDAEDMVQETFLKLISSKKQFESEEHEKAWLIVTASNTCKDELKRWKRRLENIRSLFQEENVVQTEDDRVLEWVMALPAKYKQVIYLYYYEGYQTSEIAGMPHCSESTVRNQLLRGRRLLKKNSVYHAKSGVAFAAILAGSLLVATTVYAIYTYGLRNLHMGKENVLDISRRDELPDEVSEKDIPKKEVDIITVGGIEGNPEYMANAEWREFLGQYDVDGAISAEIGNGFAGLPEEYELTYHCYTQEMADKVDELNVGRIEEYHEWDYSTRSGQVVRLANSNWKALIVTERDNSFIVVNVLGDLWSDTFEVSDEMLEELADLFDFAMIP